ncbi:MAG: ABC transporter ATP-binding protein [Chthonomonadales bacterium]|nr:ABC transporter ATP-binding protein [Chthonomonadales bacterium]
MPILQTHALTKIYGNRLIAVNGINLTVEPGWVFGLLGPNGAGKTTLLKLLLGLQRPTAGRAELFGSRVGPNAASLRQRVGYLPTNPRFPPTMSPISYLDLIGQLFGMGAQERKPRLASLIRAVDLLPHASRSIKGFSTGQTTRLGIAASLMNDPELLIWDEPTSGLDPAGRKYTLDLIRELGKTKTIVVSSHILTDIDRVCDHVGIVHDGKLIYCGSVRHLKQTIGRNNVDLEVDGPWAQLEDLTRRAEATEGVVGCERRGDQLTLRFRPTEQLAAPLGRILMAATELGVDVLSVSSTRGQTEEAFIRLLEADQADGFSRAFGELSSGPDGLECSA